MEEQNVNNENQEIPGIKSQKWMAYFDIKYLFFLFVLAMLHIANNHNAMSQIRAIARLGKELKEKRWEYLTTKSDLMNRSKLSEVKQSVDEIGLKELVNPPNKIMVKEEEYKTNR